MGFFSLLLRTSGKKTSIAISKTASSTMICRQTPSIRLYPALMSTTVAKTEGKKNAVSFSSISDTTTVSRNEDGQCREWTPQLTKIVATIGPTSEQFSEMQEVVNCGMRIMRLNFSHATEEEVELRVANIRKCQGSYASDQPLTGHDNDENNVRGVLLDTRGPEIRMGKLRDDVSGHDTITLTKGSTVTIHTTEDWANAGSISTDLYIDYGNLHQSLSNGSKVLLDDGAISMTVISVESDKQFHGTVTCTVDNTGELRSRAGVNLPGAETDLPAMSTKDKIDIRYGMTFDIDYIAASFVQNADGVKEIRRYTSEVANELGWDVSYPLPRIISKIESASALQNFDEILAESDGIMVARGDLGVEIPIHQVTNAQKEMIAACNAVGKPVIVATQMLESMAKNPRPTRAEVSDVSNAVFDGADAVMTSGETAKGKYPIETIKMMNEIILSAERFSLIRPDLVGRDRPLFSHSRQPGVKGDTGGIEASVAKAAVAAASKRGAVAILVLLTVESDLARLLAAYRPDVPVVVFAPSAKIARQLILHRALHPVVGKLHGVSTTKRPFFAIEHATRMGLVCSGDDVVVVGVETDEFSDAGSFATMRIVTVP